MSRQTMEPGQPEVHGYPHDRHARSPNRLVSRGSLRLAVYAQHRLVEERAFYCSHRWAPLRFRRTAIHRSNLRSSQTAQTVHFGWRNRYCGKQSDGKRVNQDYMAGKFCRISLDETSPVFMCPDTLSHCCYPITRDETYADPICRFLLSSFHSLSRLHGQYSCLSFSIAPSTPCKLVSGLSSSTTLLRTSKKEPTHGQVA